VLKISNRVVVVIKDLEGQKYVEKEKLARKGERK